MCVLFLASSIDVDYNGHSVHLTMLPNPSHLEVGSLIGG